MAKRFGLYVGPDDPPEFVRLIEAFHAGLAREGEIACLIRDPGRVHAFDVAVFCNWLRPKRDWRRRIRNVAVAEGGAVIALNHGFVRRGTYYAAGWDGINGRADYVSKGVPPDRWDALGVEVAPWREDGREILLCGQTPGDPSLYGIDFEPWLTATLARLREVTDRPIVWRPHPNVRARATGIPGTRYSEASLEDDLAVAWAVVTCTSTSSAMAALHGVPVFAESPASIAWPVAGRDLARIEDPPRPDRTAWLNGLGYSQWTLGEIASGAAWRHLRRRLEKEVDHAA